MSARHPEAGICRSKKSLSYIIGLCQPSFRLFESVDKAVATAQSAQPGSGVLNATRTGLNFPEL